MTFNHSLDLYSKLFNGEPKDYDFYKSLFTSPVHPSALLSIMEVNCESTMTAAIEPDVSVISDMYSYGRTLLSDAMEYYDHDENEIEEHTVAANGATERLRNIGSEDVGEGDENMVLGNEDEKDLTDLQDDTESRPIQVLPTTSSASGEVREFDKLDEELRIELVINILQIFQVWYQCMGSTNRKLYSRKNSFGTYRGSDLTVAISQQTLNLHGTHEQAMASLLRILKYHLNKIFCLSNTTIPEPSSLWIAKEIFSLLVDILNPLFLGIDHYEKDPNRSDIFKGLIANFFLVDFSSVFDRIMTITLNTYDESAKSFIEPSLRLSTETLLRLYTLVGILSRIPHSSLPITAAPVSSDITNIGIESSNPYDKYLESKKLDKIEFQTRFSSRLIPLLAIDFNFYYQQAPDLLESQITSSSFINWITGNRFNNNSYVKYDTVKNITSLETNFSNLTLVKKPNESLHEELLHLQSMRMHRSKTRDEVTVLYDLLPITLYLYSHTKNAAFLDLFSTQFNVVSHRIEDIVPEEDQSIELLEIWLCVLSYNYQNQHTSKHMQNVTKLSLLILLKLTSNYSLSGEHEHILPQNIKNYKINEFKWKLAHQRAPIIPLDIGDDGYKSCILYIIDCLQILFRFNMTKKLNVEIFRLGANILLQILEFIYTEKELALGAYNFSELYRTLFSVLVFIEKHKLISSKHFEEESQKDTLKSLVEEITIILDFMLSNKFSTTLQLSQNEPLSGSISQILKSMNFHLVYSILLNYDSIKTILSDYDLNESKSLARLHDCLRYFKIYFEPQENSEVESLVFDSDSPLLDQKISEYLEMSKEKPEIFKLDASNASLPKYRYKHTFAYANRHYKEDLVDKNDLLEIFNMLLALNFKQI